MNLVFKTVNLFQALTEVGGWRWHGVCGAGRRSAGVGSKGGTQAHAHTVGVRARVGISAGHTDLRGSCPLRESSAMAGDMCRWQVLVIFDGIIVLKICCYRV